MTWETVTSAEAAEIATARLGAGPRTNYFRQPLPTGDVLVSRTRDSVVLLVPEYDFHRLYFATVDTSDLREVVAGAPVQTDISVTHIHKLDESDVREAFTSSGYAPYAEYRRMTTRNLPAPRPASQPEFATPADADAISTLLEQTFDRFTDHLPARELLLERVAKREVIVRRSGNAISGFVIFVIDGAVCNFNYLFSDRDDPLTTMILLNQFYAALRERGIQRGFLWANSRNTAVVRLHERFRWKHDGLRASYYLRSA